MNPKTKLSTELAAFVAEYHKRNEAFEKALNERHSRWESRGLLKSVAPQSRPGRNGRRA